MLRVASDDEEYDEEQDEVEVEGAPELEASESIDALFKDRQYADDIIFLENTKINKDTLPTIKELGLKRGDYYFKRSKDKIRDAKKFEEELNKLTKHLQKTQRSDTFLTNWVMNMNLAFKYYYQANASSLQLLGMYRVLFEKLLTELEKVYAMGARNYMNIETKDRYDAKFVELMAMGREIYGLGIDEKVRKGVELFNQQKEQLRTLHMSKEQARLEIVRKKLFDVILKKTDFKAKTFPTASECYHDVPHERAIVIEAKDSLVKDGMLKEEGKGRGTPKRLVLKTDQFVLVKSGSERGDKYRPSRENDPPEGTDEPPEEENGAVDDADHQ